MDSALGGTLSAFEVMWNDFYSLIAGDSSRHKQPLDPSHPFYVLLESTGGHERFDLECFEEALADAFETELISDAALAQSRQQRENLWAIRDDIEELNRKLFPSIVFDVSLDIPQMDGYVNEVRKHLSSRWPDSKMVVFGHLGDGNIHMVVTVGSLEPPYVTEVEDIVYEALGRRSGVISAEHGIGLDKREYLKHSRSEDEITLMKTLKQAMDPRGILNPGKIF
jgi:FAD/FMN-containing dehydrogenase